MIPNMTGRVAADPPGPDDTHCQVVWFGPPQDGLHRKIFEGPVEPIENYADVLAWAQKMASQMVYSLYVVPMTGAEALRTEQMKLGVANLTNRQRGELRREVVATLTAVMRDSDDLAVRADAYDILKEMKVVRP
jgi:hypothetical protein